MFTLRQKVNLDLYKHNSLQNYLDTKDLELRRICPYDAAYKCDQSKDPW